MPVGLREDTEKLPASRWLIVPLLCGLIQMLDGYDSTSIGVIVPALAKEWALRPAAFTQAFALSSVGIMVGAIVAGPIADRFGRRPVLLVSVLTFGVFSLASSWAPSLGWLVVLRFLTGLGVGGAMPTTVALTAECISERWRTTVITFMFCGNALGSFVVGQAASVLIPHWGWHAVFFVGGMVPLALLPFLLFLPEVRHPSRVMSNDPPKPIRRLFSPDLIWTTLLLWVIFLFNLLSMFLISYWLPTVLNLQGLTPAAAAASASYFSAGGIICTLILGLLLARLRPEWVLATNILVGMCAIMAILLGKSVGPALDALVFVTGAGFVGSQLGLNGFAATAYPAEIRSTGIGWALGVGRLGGILGPVIGGALLGLGFSPSTVLESVCAPGAVTVVALLILSFIRGPRSGERTPSTSGRFSMMEPGNVLPKAAVRLAETRAG